MLSLMILMKLLIGLQGKIKIMMFLKLQLGSPIN